MPASPEAFRDAGVLERVAVPSQVAVTQWETDAEFSVATRPLDESVEGPHEFNLCGDDLDEIRSASFSSSFLDGFEQDLEDEQASVNFAKAAPRKRSRLQIVRVSQAPTEAMSESMDSRASPQDDFVGLMAVEVATPSWSMRLATQTGQFQTQRMSKNRRR